MTPFRIAVAVLLPVMACGHLVAQGGPERATVPGLDMAAVTAGAFLQDDAVRGGLVGGGAHYRVRFLDGAMVFEPALGRAVPVTQHVTMRPLAVLRGGASVAACNPATPRRSQATGVVDHAAGVQERYEVRSEGVELSWRFAAPLSGEGDLIVRYAFDTNLPSAVEAGGALRREIPDVGGVVIGRVTGVDAGGTSVEGRLLAHDGCLDLVLPGGFVDGAAFPIVLDPLIGPTGGRSEPTHDIFDYDIAFDPVSAHHVLVWQFLLSLTDADIRGQRTDGTVAFGNTFLFSTTEAATSPRLASVPGRGLVALIWKDHSGLTNKVMLQCYEAQSGVLSTTYQVASGTQNFGSVDLAGDSSTAVGHTPGLLAVYDDPGFSSIRFRPYAASGATLVSPLVAGNAVSLWTNNPLLSSVYDQPAVSRAAGEDGRLLVVAHRRQGQTQTHSVIASVVTIDGSSTGPSVATNFGGIPAHPEVDGVGSRWVAAAVVDQGYTIATVLDLNAAGTTLAHSALVTVHTSPTMTNSIPTSVAYTPACALVSYSTAANELGYGSVDPTTAAPGNDSAVVYPGPLPPLQRVALLTGTASGQPGDDGFALYPTKGQEWQLVMRGLQTNAGGGSVTNLGGGCGTGGTQSFSGPPSIGSNVFTCSIGGLPPTAILAVFNFATSGPALSCGACAFTPWLVTITQPPVAGGASVQFVIPSRASLIGVPFETQWTSLNLVEAPCPLVPNLVLSDRALLVLGP